jgi:hypothetical protein
MDRDRGHETTFVKFDPQHIQRTMIASAGDLRACYLPATAAEPSLRGWVIVGFVVNRDGSVAFAWNNLDPPDLPADVFENQNRLNLDWVTDARTNPLPSSVTACVIKKVSTLRFQHPGHGRLSVAYPLLFAPDD